MATLAEAQSSIPGEYYLRGVMEVGSGFLLKPDSTFQFFFSYGALDREGSGKWHVSGNELILNSKPRPPHDFALITSRKTGNDVVTIKITDDNPLLVRYVFAKMAFADTTIEGMTSEKGEISFPKKDIKSLSLVFQFCPEKISVFELNKDHNYFEFRFEPWIMEYFFPDHHLKIENEGLKGKHPLLDDKEYLFQKKN